MAVANTAYNILLLAVLCDMNWQTTLGGPAALEEVFVIDAARPKWLIWGR